jgi:hypothetical protein
VAIQTTRREALTEMRRLVGLPKSSSEISLYSCSGAQRVHRSAREYTRGECLVHVAL